MADTVSSIDDEQSIRAEEQAVALAASKLTRPTTRLANDVLLLIATRGTARDLGKAQVVSRGWKDAARREVGLRTAGRSLNYFTQKPAYLRSIELLDAVVGPKPAGSWRDRWPELQYAKFLRVDESLALLHDRETVLQLFRNNIHVIDAELAKIRESIDWKVQWGWPRTLAEDYTLIMTHFKAALGESVSEASRDFAAAVHLLRDALTLRAPLEAVAPDAYTDLDGTYGMKTNDGAWAALTPDAAPGVSFVTHAPLEVCSGVTIPPPRHRRDVVPHTGERAPALPLGRGLFRGGGAEHRHRLRADGFRHRPLPVAGPSGRQASLARPHRGDAVGAAIRPAAAVARHPGAHRRSRQLDGVRKDAESAAVYGGRRVSRVRDLYCTRPSFLRRRLWTPGSLSSSARGSRDAS